MHPVTPNRILECNTFDTAAGWYKPVGYEVALKDRHIIAKWLRKLYDSLSLCSTGLDLRLRAASHRHFGVSDSFASRDVRYIHERRCFRCVEMLLIKYYNTRNGI